MEPVEQAKRNVADLHWLATVLTGSRETAADVTLQALDSEDGTNSFFSIWMDTWSRRIVIAKALATIREEIIQSTRRTASFDTKKSKLPPRSWALDGKTTRSDLERALLPIDAFPRAAVLLLLFERVPLRDSAVLLDAEPDLVRKGLAEGVRELTINLAAMQGWKSEGTGFSTDCEEHDVRPTEILA